MAYTQILYQLIFSTKDRTKSLKKDGRDELYKYLWGALQKRKCHPYKINGVDDHIHFAFSLHPTVSLSSLVKDIKSAGTFIVKDKKLFNDFIGWQESYSAFTYSIEAKESLIQYISNQEEHHKHITFKDELKILLKEHGVVYNEKYL